MMTTSTSRAIAWAFVCARSHRRRRAVVDAAARPRWRTHVTTASSSSSSGDGPASDDAKDADALGAREIPSANSNAEDWRAFRSGLIERERRERRGGGADEADDGACEAGSWAHALRHIERGSLLLGPDAPLSFVDGGIWTRCVLLILGHDDAQGTTGVIVNRECTDAERPTLREYAPELDFSNPLLSSLATARCGFGGPVMHDQYPRSLVVLSAKACEGVTVEVMKGLYVCDVEALARQKSKLSSPVTLTAEDLTVFVGYAGWTRNQLVEELEDPRFWTLAAADATLLRDAFFDSKCMGSEDHGDEGWMKIRKCFVDIDT